MSDAPLYTALVDVAHGRAGSARSADGVLDITLAAPKELGGDGAGTNPEQLFAAGFAACFLSSVAAVGRRRRLELGELSGRGEVDLHRGDGGGFRLGVRLTVAAPQADATALRDAVAEAEQVCPYAAAVRGNIPVDVRIES
ncbi:Ohr family peroxiredoxin [Actinoallomurus iriomotensis]|uniref:Organic hydroperoxide resistance protein n=1 Tax=Actinoallomurus iriomotensis TaxID=478107 RepID=A0A9W6S4A4_9ACTN|nr:Ohr family peroxiredoxin [Actinoallomurus iriomotensis]GLY85367.1 organic hydroperoxide resistance protein [Actinoallomurus iriomotensis]